MKILNKIKVTTILMPKGNRMVRVGVGQHEGIWFARFDLWFIGFRFSENKDGGS